MVPPIESQKELDTIKDVLNLERCEFKFMSIPARVDLFGESLDLKPLALHYSGHGLHIENQ